MVQFRERDRTDELNLAAELARRVRSRVARRNLALAYARMAREDERERDALEWAEATFRDVASKIR